jgi:hypothetical protein
MSGLTPLKLTREKAADAGLASQSDWTTPAKENTGSKTNFSQTSTVVTYGKNKQEPVLGYIPGKPTATVVRTKSKGGIKRSKRSKSKKNRRTRRR